MVISLRNWDDIALYTTEKAISKKMKDINVIGRSVFKLDKKKQLFKILLALRKYFRYPFPCNQLIYKDLFLN